MLKKCSDRYLLYLLSGPISESVRHEVIEEIAYRYGGLDRIKKCQDLTQLSQVEMEITSEFRNRMECKKRILLKFNIDDVDIVEEFKKHDNVTQYVKNCIRENLNRQNGGK